MIKTKAVRVRAGRRYLVVTIEQDFGGALRWCDVHVPWRLLNEHYREVVEGMEHEALEHLRLVQHSERLPGID